MNDDTTVGREAENLPSGRFVLRIDPRLHRGLRERAREEGISLNDLCARRLALPERRLPPEAGNAVVKAFGLMDQELQGVVAFGSWARREMTVRSDLDLLLIVDREVEIGRSLYRKWDEDPLIAEGHRVEPHFVHLPVPDARISGFWAEVAVDGVVLFDRELEVSRALARLRSRIASGEITRRRIHGHPYWVEVA